MREIGSGDLRDIAHGAAILGTGGGGDPYIGRLLAEQAIQEHGPVSVVTIDELPDDAVIAGTAIMGAPTVLFEKPPRGDEAVAAFRALEDHLGSAITYVLPLEIGGANSLVPIAVAAALGLPVVDADCMGRAFPNIQMVLCTLDGIAVTPMVLADEQGNSVLLRTCDNHWAEHIARSALIAMGCTALLGTFPMSGRQARHATIPGTLSLAAKVGHLADETRRALGDPAEAVVELLGGRVLFTGKVVDVDRRTLGGFARGEAHLTGVDGDTGSKLDLAFQNEHLVARRDGRIVATVPDLICALDTDNGHAVTTEVLRYGQRLSVLAAPSHPRWRTPEGLALAGPRAFGYQHDHIPLPESPPPSGSTATTTHGRSARYW